MIIASLIAAAVSIAGAHQGDGSKYGELVFALDISGSTYESQYALRGLALETAKGQFDYYGVGNVRVAVATYGWPDKRLRILPFTKNPQQILAYLAGDMKSYFNTKELGSDTALAMLKLDWTLRPDVKRKLILMGNESLRQTPTAAPLQTVALKAKQEGILLDTVFTPFGGEAGGPQEYIDLAHMAQGNCLVLSESDFANYTEIWKKYRDGYEWDLRMEEQRKAQNSYLEGLLNKRSQKGG